MNKLTGILNNDSLYSTERISILNWKYLESQYSLTYLREFVLEIMAPEVTKSLPDGWQNLNTPEKAKNWILDRKKDSHFYGVSSNESKKLIGFLFLYPEPQADKMYDIRIGYVLSSSTWGKGIGSELIHGLVNWSKSTGMINNLIAGVEEHNIGSVKVLLKNGFHLSLEGELPKGTQFYKIHLKI